LRLRRAYIGIAERLALAVSKMTRSIDDRHNGFISILPLNIIINTCIAHTREPLPSALPAKFPLLKKRGRIPPPEQTLRNRLKNGLTYTGPDSALQTSHNSLDSHKHFWSYFGGLWYRCTKPRFSFFYRRLNRDYPPTHAHTVTVWTTCPSWVISRHNFINMIRRWLDSWHMLAKSHTMTHTRGPESQFFQDKGRL
jgi:hypothetical protein